VDGASKTVRTCLRRGRSVITDDARRDGIAARLGAQVTRTGEFAVRVRIPGGAGEGEFPFGIGLLAVDMAAGISANYAGAPQAVVTSDIDVRTFGLPSRGGVIADAQVVRRGNGQVLASCRVSDSTGATVAVATVNHAITRMVVHAYFHDMEIGETVALADLVPKDMLAPEIRHTPDGNLIIDDGSRNMWGMGHGAVLAAFAEAAVQRATHGPTRDLLVRFVAPARVGPVVARLASVRERYSDFLCSVRLDDEGTGETVAWATASAERLKVA
jgi:acyl-coenzyme A thioesterase PaaI-like protein